MAKKYFPEHWNDKRIEFLPVDWRTSLTLNDGREWYIDMHACVAFIKRRITAHCNLSLVDCEAGMYSGAKYGDFHCPTH